MNERILELAEQAGMTDDKFGMFFSKDYESHCHDGVDLEKFAELIVRECAKKIQIHKTRIQANAEYMRGHNDACDDAVSIIKKHFGVEE
jgi:hypothetical protein